MHQLSQSVARQPTASSPAVSGARLLRRQCACGQHTIGGTTCEGCRRQASACGAGPSRAPHKGETTCESGKLVPRVFNEHVIGDCVHVHEEAHKNTQMLAELCGRFEACRQRDDYGVPDLDPTYPADMAPNLCLSTYNAWFDRNEADIELPAYSAEKVCLEAVIDAQCGGRRTRARNIGGAIGAAVLGIGGAIGGAFGGMGIAEHFSSQQSDKTTGGVIGGIGGGLVGAGLGWIVGGAIGKAAAGAQASEEDCKMVQGELDECNIAIKGYKARVAPEPLPFLPDGRIIKSFTRGITAPKPDGAKGAPTSQQDPAAQPPAIQARTAIGGRERTRADGDLSAIPAFSRGASA